MARSGGEQEYPVAHLHKGYPQQESAEGAGWTRKLQHQYS